MGIKYRYDVEQGSEEWKVLKRGIITASNIHNIITPVKKEVSKSNSYLYDFCRKIIDGMKYGDFSNVHTDRGQIEEKIALNIYSKRTNQMYSCGIVINDDHGIIIGCSPDALVGDEGGVEVKSFLPNLQFCNIVNDKIDPKHMLQVQFSLLVTQRQWWDVVYHSSGTHMMITRVYPDKELHTLMIAACKEFYSKVDDCLIKYRMRISNTDRFTPTDFVPGIYDQQEEEEMPI